MPQLQLPARLTGLPGGSEDAWHVNARHTLQSVTDPDGLVTNHGPSRISLSLQDVAGEPLTGLRRQEGESLTVAKAARPAVNLRRCRCRQSLGPDSNQHAPSYEAREPFSGPGKPRVPFCCTSWLSQPTGQPPGWPPQAAWGPKGRRAGLTALGASQPLSQSHHYRRALRAPTRVSSKEHLRPQPTTRAPHWLIRRSF